MGLYLLRETPVGPPVTAIQVRQDTYGKIAVWTNGLVVRELTSSEGNEYQIGINVPTEAGMDRASEGDYVVQDMSGAFHIFRMYQFESKFQEVGVEEAPAPAGHIDVRALRLKRMEPRDG